MTSAVVTAPTGMRPMQGKATRVSPDIQSRPYRGLRQPGRICRQTRSAAAAKVGSSAARFAANGSPPARASLRLAKAWARASSSETRGKLPRPISHRRPRTATRCTQLRLPEGWTSRYRPWPSQ